MGVGLSGEYDFLTINKRFRFFENYLCSDNGKTSPHSSSTVSGKILANIIGPLKLYANEKRNVSDLDYLFSQSLTRNA